MIEPEPPSRTRRRSLRLSLSANFEDFEPWAHWQLIRVTVSRGGLKGPGMPSCYYSLLRLTVSDSEEQKLTSNRKP